MVNNVVRALFEAPPEDFDVLPVYADAGNGWYRYARRFAAAVLNRKEDTFNGQDDDVELQAGDVFIGLDLHHRTTPPEVSMPARMRAAGGSSYFVVYDLLPVLMPQHFPGALSAVHLQWLQGLSDADGVVCISKAVADEFIAWLPTTGTQKQLKVGYFHLGSDLPEIDSVITPNDDQRALLEAMDKRPSFLMVGTLEPRKGHLQALIAFEQLWDEGNDVNLVIVGKHGWNVDLQTELIRTSRQLGTRLFWVSRATDAFLQTIYRRATCLIAASEGEGFGLPLVEAAVHGIPAIARDIPVFREVAVRSATFFTGNDGRFSLIGKGFPASSGEAPSAWRGRSTPYLAREQGATA